MVFTTEIEQLRNFLTEGVWLQQFLFGMFLAYYIMSPRLRRFINRIIVWLFNPERPFIPQPPQPHFQQHHYQRQTAPSQRVMSRATTLEAGQGYNHIAVDDNKLDEWFNNNPELRKLNEV